MNRGITITLCVIAASVFIVGTATGCKDKNGGTLADKGSAGEYEYEVEITGWFGNFFDDRGYYIETTDGPDDPCYIIICSGERSCGGYDILIDKVGIQDDLLVITVEETSPGPNTACPDVINYPYCVLKLNKVPEKLRIIDKNGYEFKKYGAFDERILENIPYKDLRWLDKDYKLPDGWDALFRQVYDDTMYETYVYKDGTGYKCFNIYVTPDFPDTEKNNHRFISEINCASNEAVINAVKDYRSDGVMILPDDQSKSYPVNDFIKMDI